MNKPRKPFKIVRANKKHSDLGFDSPADKFPDVWEPPDFKITPDLHIQIAGQTFDADDFGIDVEVDKLINKNVFLALRQYAEEADIMFGEEDAIAFCMGETEGVIVRIDIERLIKCQLREDSLSPEECGSIATKLEKCVEMLRKAESRLKSEDDL